MKKQVSKTLQTIQEFQNIQILSKTKQSKIKGGDDIVVEETIID